MATRLNRDWAELGAQGAMDRHSAASPTADESAFDGIGASAEEVRTLLGSRSSGVKARKGLLCGFVSYSIASEAS